VRWRSEAVKDRLQKLEQQLLLEAVEAPASAQWPSHQTATPRRLPTTTVLAAAARSRLCKQLRHHLQDAVAEQRRPRTQRFDALLPILLTTPDASIPLATDTHFN